MFTLTLHVFTFLQDSHARSRVQRMMRLLEALELLTPSFVSFSPSLKKQRRTKQDNEGQSNHHGAVNIVKSEQQLREAAVITLAV